jgi:APA family basic amino acid/polyamine antiporter
VLEGHSVAHTASAPALSPVEGVSSSAQGAEPVVLKPELGLFSATAIVAGGMIGSGIFIVSAETARTVGTEPLLLLVWAFAGLLTILGGLSYGKFAAYAPQAGGQYVFLKQSWGDLPGFLYGWAMFLVIQTGTLAAVAVAFAKFLGVLLPAVSSKSLLVLPLLNLGISSQQLVAVGALLALTAFNTTGVKNGALLQNLFTSLKVLALLIILGVGLTMGTQLLDPAHGVAAGWQWSLPAAEYAPLGGLASAFALAMVGPLFACDTWNYITFLGGEVKEPSKNLPRALAIGTGVVVVLYFLVNLGYVNLLPLSGIQHAAEDRVGTAALQQALGGFGVLMTTWMILISTFGCLNGLMLAGARLFYAMAGDGMALKWFGALHPTTRTPNASLWAQCLWASLLALSGSYGQLLDYIIFTALVFYILTMLGLIKLGRKMPEALHMTRWQDYALPIAYLVGVGYIGFYLLIGPGKWVTSLAGLGLTLSGLPVYFWWKSRRDASAAAA